MKAEAKLLLGLGALLRRDGHRLLALERRERGRHDAPRSAALCFLPGSYYLWWSRRMTAARRDDPNATQADGAGVDRDASPAARSGRSRSAWAPSSRCSR